MDAERLAALRDDLDEYLLRCADRAGPNPRSMQPLAFDLIRAYEDALAEWFGEMPAKVARHLARAHEAAALHDPPVIARELDAAIAAAERVAGEGSLSRNDAKQRTKTKTASRKIGSTS